ncbi:HIT domain-containing protein [Luteolibacter sp. LG18]|uniref:HIT family protein n=1 Tax=Luteolibacter sp. LG18 TaxID=2819286 RepID=UPI002B2907F7|nr:diadenosine tetraphosphate hydrolase [Luteolibacter sp. LG18]
MAFTLHPRLAAGSFDLGRLGICRLLLKNNAIFPWFLLVPEVEDGIEDLHQLTPEQHAEVTAAIRTVSIFMSAHFKPRKLNVACIGNQVQQMHIHLIARNEDDPAWPGTVWDYFGKRAYEDGEVEEIRKAMAVGLDLEQE